MTRSICRRRDIRELGYEIRSICRDAFIFKPSCGCSRRNRLAKGMFVVVAAAGTQEYQIVQYTFLQGDFLN